MKDLSLLLAIFTLALTGCTPQIEYVEVPRQNIITQTMQTMLEEQIKELEHRIWHYDEQAKWLRAENERLNQLLIDSGVFVVEHEVVVGDTGNISGVVRSYKYVKPEPEIVTVNQTIEKEVIKEVIIYRDRTNWRLFESLAEFTAWVDGKLTVLWPKDKNDCDDYTERLQILALKDGYIISAQLIDADGYLFGKRVKDDDAKEHDMIRVNIGNEIFLMEPNPRKFRIIKIGNRD